MSDKSQAYLEGREAAQHNVPLETSNPYPQGDSRYQDFVDGYNSGAVVKAVEGQPDIKLAEEPSEQPDLGKSNA